MLQAPCVTHRPHILTSFPSNMYIHVQRQFSTKRKGCEFCFDLNTFTYVSSTKRDSVVGVEIRMGGEVDGWEARRGPGGGWASTQLPSCLPSCPPDSQGLCRAPGASADFSFLRMVFGLLPIWLAVFGLILSGVGRVTFIRCLLVPVGASLAALWGDSLRIFLLLLLHLLYNFPDLALCSLQQGRGGGWGEKRNPVLRTGRGEWESGLGTCGEEVVTSDSWQGKCHLDSTAVKWQSSPPPPQGC